MNQPTWMQSSELDVPHAFMTRNGGVSAGPFATLNCSLSGQDDREAVLENRRRAVMAIRQDLPTLVGLKQVHGDAVVHVTSPWPEGEGPRADAMIADRDDIVLGIITADCAPVLFADPVRGVVGAAHAGWRGAVAGVLDATVRAMIQIGAQADRITASIGPCIGQASYEVRADLRDAVVQRAPAYQRFFTEGVKDGTWQFNLRGYCRARLEQAGVTRVVDVDLDTVAEEGNFFSHRRRTLRGEGPIGHQISVISCA
jgi:polyphenol oxidase